MEEKSKDVLQFFLIEFVTEKNNEIHTKRNLEAESDAYDGKIEGVAQSLRFFLLFLVFFFAFTKSQPFALTQCACQPSSSKYENLIFTIKRSMGARELDMQVKLNYDIAHSRRL